MLIAGVRSSFIRFVSFAARSNWSGLRLFGCSADFAEMPLPSLPMADPVWEVATCRDLLPEFLRRQSRALHDRSEGG